MIQERVRWNLKGSGRVGGGGFPYDVRRTAYIQTYMDCTDYLKCRLLQHFLAKLDARKSDDSNRGCNSMFGEHHGRAASPLNPRATF